MEKPAKPTVEQASAQKIRQFAGRRIGTPTDSAVPTLEDMRAELKANPVSQPKAAGPIRPVLTLAQNYHHTMISLHNRMEPVERQFSRFTHSPAVEGASDLLSKTIFRPSVTLGASTCALLVTASLYLYARFYGFELQGSELWLSLLAGALIGLVFEALQKAFRRMRGHV